MEYFKDHFSRIKTLLLFTVFLTSYHEFALAQSVYEQVGKLPITTYLPDEYEGYAQVWSAVEGENGLMYFGTNYGLHEHDGVSWRSVFQEGNFNSVRCLDKDPSGKIFYSGTDAFGYLEVDQFGVTQPVSLFHLIPEEFLPTGPILTFHFINDFIYLQSMDYIFRLELDADFNLKTLKSWKPETGFMYSFHQDGILYIHQMDKGLFKLEGEELAFIQGTEVLGKERLRLMLPHIGNQPDKNYLLGSNNSGFYLFDGENLKKFPTQIDAYLKDGATLNIGLLLEDGNYLLSLMGSGAAIMNPQGEVIRIIDSNHGLPSDLVIGAYVDQVGSLWVLTEEGIAWIDINSPTLDYGKDVGIKSYVYAIEKVEDELYLGTHLGLLKFDLEAKVFKAIPEINSGPIRDLLLDGKDLIISGEKLHVLRNDKLIELENPKSGTVSNQILIPKENKNILYVGTSSGLSVYRRGLSSEVPWEYIREVAGVDRAVYFMKESKDGDLWLGTQVGIAFQVTKQDTGSDAFDLGNYKVKSFGREGGSFFFRLVNGEIYWSSSSGVQRFSKAEGNFVKATEFDDIATDVANIYEDPLKRVWLITNDFKLILVTQNVEGTYEQVDYKGFIPSNVSDIGFMDTDSSMWFGEFGLVRFDPKNDSHREKPFFTLLRRVETKNETLELNQYGRKTNLSAKELKDNSFRFEFAAPFFDGEKYFAYQTFLEGFDSDWVEWNDNNFKEYTNLPPGNYIFRARALNTSLMISEEAVFSFILLPPWYAKWWAYLIYALILGLLIYQIVKFQSSRLVAREKEKARENELAQAKEIEKAYHQLEDAHKELEDSHHNLKSTQAQLIQSEKMASLGQLTAGIAHEIQNPLNFVNNFSEVSSELMEELKGERLKVEGERDEAIEEEIIEDVIQNLEKINHHGKRADAIVKGMLEHSRASSGEKVQTDINALADEYLRLSYHGMRAKDKSFSAEFITDFDPTLPKIYVVPQEIGRVLLNLINNAFYACSQTSKGYEPLEGFKPLVKVSTKNLGDKIEISISDNGPGIPDSIKDKIFQPFFTTKPTGQGTGLGLSLSYDIVKAHGGELKVETQEGKGSEFTISLVLH